MSLLCMPILFADPDAALRDAHAAKAAGADLVEYRIDEYFTGEPHHTAAIAALVSDSFIPCILTCRTAAEGGNYEGDEETRLALFEHLITAFGLGNHPPRYLDIELSSYTPAVRDRLSRALNHPERTGDLSTSLILSTHDFSGRPADLSRRLLKLHAEPAAKVLKIAFRARSLRDNIELFDLLSAQDRPTIALGMGEFGLISRILAPKFGGFLTFASLRPTATTAPGQPTINELLNLFRFRSINQHTSVYGVVGYPIGHSLSPAAHNAAFDATSTDAVYLPLPIAEGYESLKATLGELLDHRRLDLRGLSITLPHKENLLRLARESGWKIDPVAAAIGAANTLAATRNPDGSLAHCRIINTDAPALLDSLRQAAGDPAGKKAAIIGAGGVARAAAYALAAAGAHVTIYNRTRARADELAASVSRSLAPQSAPITAANLGDLPAAHPDFYIHCTPAGMSGGVSEGLSLLSAADFRNSPPGAVVLETVYNPIDTPLLAAAREAGLRTVDGVSMFVRQAAAQFSVWTGKPPPMHVMARAVREALSRPAG